MTKDLKTLSAIAEEVSDTFKMALEMDGLKKEFDKLTSDLTKLNAEVKSSKAAIAEAKKAADDTRAEADKYALSARAFADEKAKKIADEATAKASAILADVENRARSGKADENKLVAHLAELRKAVTASEKDLAAAKSAHATFLKTVGGG